VDEQHAVLLGPDRNEEDVMFRKERVYLKPEEVIKRVAGEWGMEENELVLQRRAWKVKGAAAYLLEKYAGLSRRACAPWIKVTNGSGVAYQIGQALKNVRQDPVFARKVAKLEKQLEKVAADGAYL
jgi:hypothetical protein